MVELFGLDFGTTNTLAALYFPEYDSVRPFLVGERPHPSVVQYHGTSVVAGREARDQLDNPGIGVYGDVVRSPKHWLGSGSEIYVAGIARDPAEVVGDLLKHVHRHAVEQLPPGTQLGNAVVTIPVGMDGRGRRALREAARTAGFDIYQFVHEPLAALYGYIRRSAEHRRLVAQWEGKLIVVFDWGGGTLDLTLCQVVSGVLLQIANVGDAAVGGDRFDERLMLLAEQTHQTSLGVRDAVLVPGAKAKLNAACELAKIRLSREATANVLVTHYAEVNGETQALETRISRQDLEAACLDLVDAGLRRLDELLSAAGVSVMGIELCLATGGMTQMPLVRSRLIEKFGGPARVPNVNRADQIIAEGAAWIAADQQPLLLAKPLELLHADNAYVPVFDAGTELPTLGRQVQATFSMYCVDPRDGFARFLLARPLRPERTSSSDERRPYGVSVLAVDSTAEPLRERLNLNLAIDEDLIVHVGLESSLMQDKRFTQIHDLEFGLAMGRR